MRQHRYVVFIFRGTQASYLKLGLDPQEGLLKQGAVPKGSDWGAESAEDYGVLHSANGHVVVPTQVGGYQHFFANLADAIMGKADLIVTPQQALDSLKIIELAIQSSDSGKTLVVA